MLFVQGSRDTFGTPAELKPVLAALPLARPRCTSSRAAITRSRSRAGAGTRQNEIDEEVRRTVADWDARVQGGRTE